MCVCITIIKTHKIHLKLMEKNNNQKMNGEIQTSYEMYSLNNHERTMK